MYTFTDENDGENTNLELALKDSFPGDEVKKIKITGKVGNITIVESEGNTVYYETYQYDESEIRVRLEDGVLKIKDLTKKRDCGIFDFLNSKNKNKNKQRAEIKVFVPKEKKLELLKIESGVGPVTVSNIHTKKIKFDAGVGSAVFTNTHSDKVAINGGVGEIIIKQCAFANFNLEAGVGNVKFSGTLKEKTSIKMGVGSIKMDIEDDVSNYNIESSMGLGSITIDGKKIRGSGCTQINNSAPNDIIISGGIGNISVSFNE